MSLPAGCIAGSGHRCIIYRVDEEDIPIASFPAALFFLLQDSPRFPICMGGILEAAHHVNSKPPCQFARRLHVTRVWGGDQPGSQTCGELSQSWRLAPRLDGLDG